MPSSDSFLRQLSSKEGWKSASKRWGVGGGGGGNGWGGGGLKQMEGLCGGDNGMFVMKKRVMVVVDQSSHSKHAMMWALTHVTNKGDILTLLHIVSPSTKNSDTYSSSSSSSSSPYLATSLGSLCKACKPEVSFLAPFGSFLSFVLCCVFHSSKQGLNLNWIGFLFFLNLSTVKRREWVIIANFHYFLFLFLYQKFRIKGGICYLQALFIFLSNVVGNLIVLLSEIRLR